MSKQEKKTVLPARRFPEFRGAREWQLLHGDKVFDQISNKDHNSDLPILAITQEYGAIPRGDIDYHVSVTEKSIESYKVVEDGDFIISLRSFQGGIEYSNYQGLCSPAYVVLRKRINVSNNFYKQFFKTSIFIQSMNKNIEGIRDGKMVSYKQFSELLLPCPILEEQQKIADCLTSIDELITTQIKKFDALKNYKKGLMQQLFPAKGETMPKRRFPEFQDKGEWCAEELGSKTIKVGSGITPNGGNKNYKSEGRPFVRSQNVGWGRLILDDVAYIDEETHSSFPATEIKRNDVLLNITGGSIGRSAVANLQIESGNVNQHVCIIRTKKKELDPFFLSQFLISQTGQHQIDSFQAGGNRQGLNFVQIRSFSIPMPPKIEEQQKIAECLISIDELIAAQAQKIDALKAHKNGLMQQLFPAMDEVSA